MADVKWIKVTTDIFDDEKILLIEQLPEADSIIVIWFKLLCFAGKLNSSGVFMMNDRIAYTDKMLAAIFRRKEATVQFALKTFEDLGMIEIVNNAITIPNWGKHQNLDKIEARNEYMKKYMREYREKQRMLTSGGCSANRKLNGEVNVNNLEEDIEKELEPEKDTLTFSNEKVCRTKDVRLVIEEWNKTDFKKIERISPESKRGGMVRKRIIDYGTDKVVEAIHKANMSSFLKGDNSKGWTATFDWFIRPENFQKVLEGNYIGSKKKRSFMDMLMEEESGENRRSEVIDIA